MLDSIYHILSGMAEMALSAGIQFGFQFDWIAFFFLSCPEVGSSSHRAFFCLGICVVKITELSFFNSAFSGIWKLLENGNTGWCRD